MTKGDKERYRVQAAIAAMQGLLSDSSTMANISRGSREAGISGVVYLAKASADYADALMAELGLGEEE